MVLSKLIASHAKYQCLGRKEVGGFNMNTEDPAMVVQQAWLVCLLITAIVQSFNFFRNAQRAKVLRVFGRRPMNSSSLIYLSLMGVVPLVSVLLLANCPFDLQGSDAALQSAVTLTLTAWLGQRCMRWLSLGIVVKEDE